MRGEFFRNGGEVADIAEQHRHHHLFTTQVDRLTLAAFGDEKINNIVRHIAAEHRAQALAFTFFAGQAQCERQQKGQQNRELRGSSRENPVHFEQLV